MNVKTRILLAVCFLMAGAAVCFADVPTPPAVQTQPVITPLEEKPTEAAVETKPPVAEVATAPVTAPTLDVKEVRITGNTLIPTDVLIQTMPDIYNASKKPLEEAPPNAVFDLTVLKDIMCNPGQVRQVSTKSIQGLTRYILSVYQQCDFAGIYVYVPAQAFAAGKLKDDVLLINVLEAGVCDVGVTYRDVNGVEVEQGCLRLNKVLDWSPVVPGQVADKKKLDDYINLLNLNPDRRVYATVSPGVEPNTLAVKYDIYEANPLHYFIQLDNAGTGDLEWAPRVGFINTNFLGFDDKLIGVVQGAVCDGDPTDNYAAYGSYDFPICTPRLRLNLFASRSEFDTVTAVQGLNFLGDGSSYGGILRYNACQADGWFFDLLGTMRRDTSHENETLFGTGSDVGIHLWGIGFDIHKTTDRANTSIIFNRLERFDGSGDAAFNEARPGADPDFTIITLSAAHRQFLDAFRVHRLLGSFTYIRPDGRLVPIEMTSFGGLYTVRGYEESEIIADGGIIASLQYEYDIVKAIEKEQPKDRPAPTCTPCLRKLAPCGFFDFGRAVTEDPVGSEQGVQELCSLGVGLLTELGDHFSSGLYYGWPLRETIETDKCDGRFHVNLMMRW